MKKIIALLLCMFSLQIALAQVTLEGRKLVKDGTPYRQKEYRSVLTNDEAQKLFKKSRVNGTVASVVGITGGFIFGFSATRALLEPKERVMTFMGNTTKIEGERKMFWNYALLGLGISAVSIPLTISANKNRQKALAIENGDAVASKPTFNVVAGPGSVALRYNF